MPQLDNYAKHFDLTLYGKLHREASFDEYSDYIFDKPSLLRSAYQRLYDCIMAPGFTETTRYRKSLIHYHFFDGGDNAIYGLEEHLMDVVSAVHGAASWYGPDRRLLLLHGPVGSSKSTICKKFKKGLEDYSRTDEGEMFTFKWVGLPGDIFVRPEVVDPMHSDPIKLLPWANSPNSPGPRQKIEADINSLLLSRVPADQKFTVKRVKLSGDLNPFSQLVWDEFMIKYKGDWRRILAEHIKVVRLIVDEKKRTGIGTFQPKDEKNQDSTELTGDINYVLLGQYGIDSDPRAFSHDGELQCANRGIMEFAEVLKLANEFLYDLLGACQERQIKPKKFSQMDIDTAMFGHSVAAKTPLPYRYDGKIGWATFEEFYDKFFKDTSGLEVMSYDFNKKISCWTPVKSIIRHLFTGKMLITSQKWGVVSTTPNHSIYDINGKVFYPEDRHEVMAIRKLPDVNYESLDVFDISSGLPNFVNENVKVTSTGGVLTKRPPVGWSKLDFPRYDTSVKTIYDPVIDEQFIKDLLTVMVWYLTEGHVNNDDSVVISQGNRAELERVQSSLSRISTVNGDIAFGSKEDDVWRLQLGACIWGKLLKHHCGRYSENKRLPDFVFNLSDDYLTHVFDELMRTDGTRKFYQEDLVSEDYKEKYFEYKTTSPVLAAQVGFIVSRLGFDYSINRRDVENRKPAYNIKFCTGKRKTFCDTRLMEYEVNNEWVYDIECDTIHNFVCGVGNVVAHNTNLPDYKRVEGDETMEALKDRTIRLDIPYVRKLSDEIKILEKEFNSDNVYRHIAPHTIEVAAYVTVLSRLKQPKKGNMPLVNKAKLYDGKSLVGFNEDSVKELMHEYSDEGMSGLSVRFGQNKFSNCLSNMKNHYINGFMVLKEMEEGLKTHALIENEEQRKHYRECIDKAKEEFEELIKSDVQDALVLDDHAMSHLLANYLDHVDAYVNKSKIFDNYTNNEVEPDERLMRSIESKAEIREEMAPDFRRSIAAKIGTLHRRKLEFDVSSDPKLEEALRMKLFEDVRDSVKLASLGQGASLVEPQVREKIDAVKQRLIKLKGYNEESAADALNFVASIFARSDIKKKKLTTPS